MNGYSLQTLLYVHPSGTSVVQCLYQCSRRKYKINTNKSVDDINTGRALNNTRGGLVIKIAMRHLVKRW